MPDQNVKLWFRENGNNVIETTNIGKTQYITINELFSIFRDMIKPSDAPRDCDNCKYQNQRSCEEPCSWCTKSVAWESEVD